MRKIRLDIDALTVESFNPDAGPVRGAGTVRGHITLRLGCGGVSELSNCASCLDGCPNETLTCQASCLNTDGNAVCKEPYC
jgi:hypothetical protein